MVNSIVLCPFFQERSPKSIVIYFFFIRSTADIIIRVFNPFATDKFYTSKLEAFADDNFEFDENGGKLPKTVESAVGKGEIARYLYCRHVKIRASSGKC